MIVSPVKGAFKRTAGRIPGGEHWSAAEVLLDVDDLGVPFVGLAGELVGTHEGRRSVDRHVLVADEGADHAFGSDTVELLAHGAHELGATAGDDEVGEAS